MYCPKCGIENPENGKFCRKCGTNLTGVSKALENEGAGGFDAADLASGLDPTGFSSSATHSEGKHSKRSNNPDDLWASGTRNTIFGFGFLIIACALFFTDVAGGRGWWWAMLFPGFSMIAGGIGSIVKAKRLEARMAAGIGGSQQNQMLRDKEQTALPPKQADYVAPDSPNYKTGDLVPSSVVNNTTRHLEMDSEGKTMTLPKKP